MPPADDRKRQRVLRAVSSSASEQGIDMPDDTARRIVDEYIQSSSAAQRVDRMRIDRLVWMFAQAG